MSECDREKETLETRVVELESQVALLQGWLDSARTDLSEALERLTEQRAAFQAMYKRLCVEMDDSERQIKEACEVFRVDQETGEMT